ncbi:MAG: c-type cytochrome [Gemmataceae bacterium]|nr:c-type cytochrome [Gemmataceae bacterium]
MRNLWPKNLSFRDLSPTGQRRLFGFGMAGVAVVTAYWMFFSDGMPILIGPTARASEIATGRELFEREWAANDPEAHGDGLGPVFNATSCAACHFQGGLGGGGGVEHNATGFEVLPRPGDHEFRTGTVHGSATDPAYKESDARLRQLFPVVKGRTFRRANGDPHCEYTATVTIPDFDPLHTQSVQPTALFGAGWLDLISDRAILRNARNRGIGNTVRELKLEFDAIPVGRVRHVAGGVGKFGWKGQFSGLREFVAAACANELGLGTPDAEQARPLSAPDLTAEPDLDRKQFRALVAFVKTLPKPVEADGGDEAARGKELFREVGCAVCHVPNMGGVKGVYSDFLLYTLDDPPAPGGGGGGDDDYGVRQAPPQLNLPGRPEDEPKPGEWKTPPLWGVADSAPYLHDGKAPTLHAAILAHKGDAKAVTARFQALPAHDKAALLAFLGTLKAPPDAHPLRNPAVTRLVKDEPAGKKRPRKAG